MVSFFNFSYFLFVTPMITNQFCLEYTNFTAKGEFLGTSPEIICRGLEVMVFNTTFNYCPFDFYKSSEKFIKNPVFKSTIVFLDVY